MKLAQFLKTSRRKAGLSQGDVAKALHYSTPQFISNWERGVSNPPVNAIKKLSKLYSIDSDDLFEVILNETLDYVRRDLEAKFKSVRA